MLNYKVILGLIAITISLIAYVPYFRDIFKGKTKPHIYTWLIWFLLTAIAFAGQLIEGAGAGAWATGAVSIASLAIFILALKKGEKNITISDKFSLFGAFFALLLWFLTSNPLIAIILIIIIDILSFYPTIRKSLIKPNEETLSTYVLDCVAFIFAIAAIESYNLVTWLYPVTLVILNFGFAGILIVKRRKYNFF